MKQVNIIAEIGVNYYDIAAKHDISLEAAAKLMIIEAKNAGFDNSSQNNHIQNQQNYPSKCTVWHWI